MELTLSFLGTGASVPSPRRNTQAVLLSRGGEQLLFDCGEGTQRQMQRSVGLVSVDRIFLSHYHADHVLGLSGLIKTYGLLERERPLEVYGPPGLNGLFESFKRLIGRTSYRLVLHETEPVTVRAGEPLTVPYSPPPDLPPLKQPYGRGAGMRGIVLEADSTSLATPRPRQ